MSQGRNLQMGFKLATTCKVAKVAKTNLIDSLLLFIHVFFFIHPHVGQRNLSAYWHIEHIGWYFPLYRITVYLQYYACYMGVWK